MKQILLLVFLLGVANSFGQSRKFFHYFKDYTRLDAGSDYPVNEKDTRVLAIPGTNYIGDTSGLKFNNEYVAFRQEHVTGISLQTWYFRFLHNEPVTVAEYCEFRNYLRDSICREALYVRVKDDKEAAKMLLISKQFIEEMDRNPENRPKDFGYENRKDNRYYFDLNWKYPLMPEKGWQNALLSDYYLPKEESFYGKFEFDWRKVIYSYFIIDFRPASKGDTLKSSAKRFINEFESPVTINTSAWENSSKSVNDEASVLGRTFLDLLPDEPIIGITGMQAVAFCDWKKARIEKELEKQGMPCFVTVTLPVVSDLERLERMELQVPERDYTSQWRIRVKDYKRFRKAVIDSIIPGVSFDNQLDNELVKGMSYEQAKAFYSWKFPMQQAKPGDDWQQFVFPSKEQFELVQNGRKVIVPAHKLEFPTPTFHYVVHITRNYFNAKLR